MSISKSPDNLKKEKEFWLQNIIKVIVVFLIGLSTTTVIVQVVLRFVFRHPLFWAEEMVRYMVIASTMLMLGPASKEGNLMGVEFVLDLFPGQIQRIIRIAVKAVSVFFYIFISYHGVKLVSKIMEKNQLSPALQIPMWIPYALIPLGLCILAVYECFAIKALISKKVKGADKC